MSQPKPKEQPDILVFPRNLDHGRLKTEEGTLAVFSKEDQEVILKFTRYFKGKVHIPETVLHRWLEELQEALPNADRRALRRVAGEGLGYRGWRPLLNRRCTLEMYLTRRRKLQKAAVC